MFTVHFLGTSSLKFFVFVSERTIKRQHHQGVSQQVLKIEAIKNWPELTDMKSVRAFVSLYSYFWKFSKDFVGLAQPHADLMKKDAFKVPFSPEVLHSIASLKTVIRRHSLRRRY